MPVLFVVPNFPNHPQPQRRQLMLWCNAGSLIVGVLASGFDQTHEQFNGIDQKDRADITYFLLAQMNV